ncbi:divalent anion:na symporter family protein [Plasmopara halstedii]|uniref:Divalent anion:na symporter family protein n=1 Tax=Plasmopara halstedii TaxID=4781 RepID=A0A0P1ATA7_PLAHL|nr:divalent anion:na symporter family protein [Plasmopara halstedii]CEG44700.1 divalent anion:na symporter family protein [Plasmopara halstedii]|eukprot:XP_024581069.1 divalent anion:na symporter family protein [Plasmopara halstedii]
MKFGKQLEISANPEWRDNYVQYKRLKRLIKRVAFEVEKKQNKQKKLQHKMELDAGDEEVHVVVDESHPLLKPVVDDVQDAKDQFWEVLDANLMIVNDFFKSKVVRLYRSVGEFEVMLEDERTPTGHVHTRSRTYSQEHGFAALQEIYDTLVDLRTFVQINHSGFRKIVKKFDKTVKTHTQDAFMKRLGNQRFYKSTDIDDLLTRVFRLTSKDKLEAGNMERRMRRMQGDQNALLRKVKVVPFCISLALFALLMLVRITPEGKDVQQRCLAMLVFITALWVTEALPYFATALLVPPLVVFLRILNDKAHPDNLLTAKQSAKEVMSMLVNHTTILIMGGYSISAAFAKCQIELYIAAFLQRRFKKSPNLFLLAIMLMGLFLSMWISNHTAPVLCVSVLLPIIRDFPTNSIYVKTLLIGLAFACNLGGMMTPISSLQNTLAVSFLEKAGYTVTFGQWMAMAVPFCTVSTVLCWAFLLWVMDPRDATYIPQIVYDQKQKISSLHVVVVSMTLLTIFLWASFSVTITTFGDLGIISMIFMFIMFGTGMLSQFDFDSFSWHILFLIGGGNVLGDAVQRSGLLDTLSQMVIHALPSGNVWMVTVSLCSMVICLTTFVSHTVASIILLPIIVQMAIQIGHPHIPVICCALAISAAMALPFSSFPNINSLLVLDDHGQPYLEVKDFLRVGVSFSLVTMALIVTLGYGLIVLVLGYEIDLTTTMWEV